MRITVRIPDEWKDRIERLRQERNIPPASPGCGGGHAALLRELLAEALDLETDQGYHRRTSERARIRRKVDEEPIEIPVAGLPVWLSTLRAKEGLSQRGLAKITGAHVTNIGRWEKGLTSPTVENLRRLRLAFPEAPWPPPG